MYLGNIPATSFETVQKDRFTGVTGTTVTLSHAVSSVNDILVFVNSVKQDYTNYSVNLTTLTLGGTLVATDIVEVCYVARTFQSVNPSAGSVNTNQLADNAVTTAKITDLNINNAKIADSSIEVGKVADSLKMKPIFKAYKSANTNLSSGVSTIVVYNGILYNPQSAYDASTGKFTVPSGSAGFYFIDICNRVTGSSGLSFKGATTGLVVNGSNEDYFSHSYTNSSSTGNFNNDQIGLTTIRELAVGDEVQGRINLTVTTGTPILVGSSAPSGGAVTRFSMFRLIGV